MTEYAFNQHDQRLIAALQINARASMEQIAEALQMTPRAAARRWSALLAGGGVRLIAAPRRPAPGGAMILRIRVLRGKTEAITTALAARDDVAFIDVSASGNELNVVLLARPGPMNTLVFRSLPATDAVAEVDAQTILHVFADAMSWRLDHLTALERERLSPPAVASDGQQSDQLDRAIIEALIADARLPAATVAAALGQPESTVRRRINALFADRRVTTQVIVDPARLGLSIDATLRMQVAPDRLDETGRWLARQPAVHGAVATTGSANLHVAVWLPDLDHLYRFITEELSELGVASVDTMIVDQAAKRREGV